MSKWSTFVLGLLCALLVGPNFPRFDMCTNVTKLADEVTDAQTILVDPSLSRYESTTCSLVDTVHT
jgi:hypothetical protein